MSILSCWTLRRARLTHSKLQRPSEPRLYLDSRKMLSSLNDQLLAMSPTIHFQTTLKAMEVLMHHEEVAGYEMLSRGLRAAYNQSAKGKGAKRHADNKPFDQQPIMLTTRRHGEGFPMGQAEKKIGEAA